MKEAVLEHANITVRDCEASARLLQDLFGWRIRWQGPAMNSGRTVHVGNDDCYVALHSPTNPHEAGAPFVKGAPLNHLGIVVPDLEATEARVIAAGLEPFSHADYAPGRRFYFFDRDGIEFEVVSYA